jgi:hypothetical protein
MKNLDTPEKVLKHIIKQKGDCSALVCDGKLHLTTDLRTCVCPLWSRIGSKSKCTVLHVLKEAGLKNEEASFFRLVLEMAKEKLEELKKLKYLCAIK